MLDWLIVRDGDGDFVRLNPGFAGDGRAGDSLVGDSLVGAKFVLADKKGGTESCESSVLCVSPDLTGALVGDRVGEVP